MSGLKTFIFSKTFLLNLLLAVVLIGGSLFFTNAYLANFTHHGETITVPDLRGLNEEKLNEFVRDKHLRYSVVDSIFELGKEPGIVLEQDPAPDSKVKENRTIYLTVNSSHPPKVKMPDLIDVSYRQAEAILQTYGLKVGQIVYKPDLAKNAVLEQHYRGNKIEVGKEIPKGSTIDLFLGDGMGSTETSIPNLVGLTRAEAMFVLKGSALNVGTVTFDGGNETEEAKVYKQNPSPGDGTIKQGEAIDLFLK